MLLLPTIFEKYQLGIAKILIWLLAAFKVSLRMSLILSFPREQNTFTLWHDKNWEASRFIWLIFARLRVFAKSQTAASRALALSIQHEGKDSAYLLVCFQGRHGEAKNFTHPARDVCDEVLTEICDACWSTMVGRISEEKFWKGKSCHWNSRSISADSCYNDISLNVNST